MNSFSFRVKDLRNPAKKWKLEKNAQQLYMTGTVLLYQVTTIEDKNNYIYIYILGLNSYRPFSSRQCLKEFDIAGCQYCCGGRWTQAAEEIQTADAAQD